MEDGKLLPVWQNREQIVKALESNQVIVVESPTGSGKTTQIPLILKEAGYAERGIIGITQPRRIATLSVCSYIQNQLQESGLPPSYCAYKMRFYDTTTQDTRIKILTDGMLLQEMKADGLLSRYSVIMVDEAHERSLNIDFILGLLKQLADVRKDLKIIISSATMNTRAFARFFKNARGEDAPVITINAKTYNVDIKYYPLPIKEDPDQITHSICQIINVLLRRFRESGYTINEDTLVFLPGEFDIKTTMESIYANCDWKHLQIYPLYGRLNKEEQEQVFQPTESGKIKVVLATNIAETSLTIDGIKTVIDSGLAKINYYNQYDFTSSLVTRPVSRSSAKQRAGRAGRTSNGVCYRLYSKEDFESRPLYAAEEILRTDLSEVVLRMSDLGIYNFEDFPYITRPDKKAIASGENTLRLLDALDGMRHLTDTGKMMVLYPLLPRHSRCIVEAVLKDPEMIMPVTVCVSFLSCKTPYVLPPGEEDAARSAHRRFSPELGDFIGCQLLFKKYSSLETQKSRQDFCASNYLDFQSMEEIVHVARQLCDITREAGIPVMETEVHNNEGFARRVLSCLCAGLQQYVCVRKKHSVYRTINADEIFIHPGSAWFAKPPAYILAGEIVLTTKLYARTVSPLKKEWISSVLPELAAALSKTERSAERGKQAENTANERGKRKSPEAEKLKKYNIYGFSFPVVYAGGKNRRPVAVIPAEKLNALARAYKKASRHPKSVNAAVLYRGFYIHYGSRLYDAVSLAGRVHFGEPVKELTQTVFFEDTAGELVPYLDLLMELSPLKKYRDRLGFVELVSSGRGMFLHVNPSFNEAVNNTAYCLLALTETDVPQEARNAFKAAWHRVVRLLD